jgi:hypothetical protein
VSASARADDDEVERRLLELLERRVEDELVLDAADADRADRGRGTAAARSLSAADAPLMQRMSWGVTRFAERTVQIPAPRCEALRPERPIERSIIRG